MRPPAREATTPEPTNQRPALSESVEAAGDLADEPGGVDVAAELAVDALQEVEIEGRGDTLGIVIGGGEDGRVLDPVRAEHVGDTEVAHLERIAEQNAELRWIRVVLAIGDLRADHDAYWFRQFVASGLVAHRVDGDGACLDDDSRRHGLGQQNHRVQRVAVLAEGVIDEPVVDGVAHRGEQVSVQVDLAGLVVDLVLVAGALGDLDGYFDCHVVTPRMLFGRTGKCPLRALSLATAVRLPSPDLR